MLCLHSINIIADSFVYIDAYRSHGGNNMAKISNHEEVLQEAEYNETQVVTNVRQGYYKSKDGIDHLWVILECIDELIYANAEKIGIDISEIRPISVKVRNPDSRDWSSLTEKTIDVSSAIVVPVIKNDQLKSLALSIDNSQIKKG